MTPTESALLAAIAANPTCALHRGVYADWLDDEGRHDEADAVRATKDRIPRVFELGWCGWNRLTGLTPTATDPHEINVANHLSNISGEEFGSLEHSGKRHGGLRSQCGHWVDYKGVRLALLDLIRAWCAVHRSEVPAVDGVSV